MRQEIIFYSFLNHILSNHKFYYEKYKNIKSISTQVTIVFGNPNSKSKIEQVKKIDESDWYQFTSLCYFSKIKSNK